MSEAYETLVAALKDICQLDGAEVTLDKHIFNDLGVDSLDFLDVTFEIDRALGVRLPIEEKLAESNEKADSELFIVRNFVRFVEEVQALQRPKVQV
jgi:acyl carrier protein